MRPQLCPTSSGKHNGTRAASVQQASIKNYPKWGFTVGHPGPLLLGPRSSCAHLQGGGLLPPEQVPSSHLLKVLPEKPIPQETMQAGEETSQRPASLPPPSPGAPCGLPSFHPAPQLGSGLKMGPCGASGFLDCPQITDGVLVAPPHPWVLSSPQQWKGELEKGEGTRSGNPFCQLCLVPMCLRVK